MEHRTDKLEDEIRRMQVSYDYDTKLHSVEETMQAYKEGRMVLSSCPRSFVWFRRQQSMFIESVFLGVPLSPLTVAPLEAPLPGVTCEVIDGCQRLRTLHEYCSGNLKPDGLERLPGLNGTVFGDLSVAVRHVFLGRTLRFTVVTGAADPDTRADIFKRINTQF